MLKLLKLPWLAIRHGQIHGYPITRNPIAWIPFCLALAVGLVAWVLICIVFVLLSPLTLTLAWLSHRSFQRKTGIFSDAGIRFPNAYGRRTIAWSDILEVVREREPKSIFYRIKCGAPENPREYFLTSTQDDAAFERTLQERQIAFSLYDWREDLDDQDDQDNPPRGAGADSQ